MSPGRRVPLYLCGGAVRALWSSAVKGVCLSALEGCHAAQELPCLRLQTLKSTPIQSETFLSLRRLRPVWVRSQWDSVCGDSVSVCCFWVGPVSVHTSLAPHTQGIRNLPATATIRLRLRLLAYGQQRPTTNFHKRRRMCY